MSEEASNSNAGPIGAGSPDRPVDGVLPAFTWQYTYKLDAQKRVAFPNEWRPADPRTLFTLILWPHRAAGRNHAYVYGLSQRRFQDLLAKLEKALRRAIFGNSTTMPLDASGRLVLPVRMADAIGLQKEVLFVGTGADFEIWDPSLHEICTRAESDLAADAYTQLV